MNAVVEPLAFAVPARTREAIGAAVASGLDALRAEATRRLADWAREHFILVGDSSHATGRWELWPFQEALLDWMSDDAIEELDVRKSKRVGYTKCLAAFMAYNAAHRHRKQALWQPTDDDRDSFVATEIDPAFDSMPVVRAARRLVKGTKDRVSFKRFRASVAHFLGGKAARAYRRITVAVALLDEIDGFDAVIEGSSDPFTLAQGRLEGAPFPKTVIGTTPRKKHSSHIERREALAHVRMRYHIECPRCGVEHPLLWGGSKVAHGFKWTWPAGALEPEVRHVCPHCRAGITQGEYLAHWHGTWVCEKTGARYGADRQWRSVAGEPMRAPRHVSAHVWAAYSPQRSWTSIAQQSEAADKALKSGDPGPMTGFVNETLGDVYEDDFEQSDKAALIARAEAYPLRLVPRRALILLAGADVQDDRIVAVVAGFGRDMEGWIVDDRILYGSPGEWGTWIALDTYLGTRFPHAAGQTCAIDAVAIDTGGHFTHMVYRYAMLREARRVYATKGHTMDGKPIVAGAPSRVDVNADGQIIKDGAKLWFIGTGTAKDLLHHRLALPAPLADQPAPGYLHLSKALPDEFFAEITSEQRVQQRVARGTVSRWVKPTSGTRNERLDCLVGILFCAARFKLEQYTDAEWRRLEEVLCPTTADLFTPPVVQPLAEPDPEPEAPPPAVMAPPLWANQRRRRVVSRGVE